MLCALNAAMQQVHGSVHEFFTTFPRLRLKSGHSANFPLSGATETTTYAQSKGKGETHVPHR
jgi:hypothetical protein